MSKRGFFKQFSFILILLVTFSCHKEFRKAQKSNDWKVKYAAAFKYYEEKDFYRSITLFEEILPIIKGSDEAEKANFFYAYSFFHDRQYITSSHFFKQFYTVYSRSDYALEAEYMHAYSLYRQSPPSRLDQSSTVEAITAMQTFLNKYPYSEYTKKANDIIDGLQQKLEEKAVNSAKEYHKLRRYKAALVVFDNFKKDYPDSKYVEEISFLEIETAYLLAKQSTNRRQKERYQSTIDLYLKYVDKYDKGQFIKTAEGYYENSLDGLKKLKTKN